MKNSALNHLRKILVHKFWVARYCFRCGLYWQGIVHDLSKFSPTEFLESVRYYRGTSSPIVACKADKGYSLAWQHHKGHNPHHYEYWVDSLDTGGIPICMPYKYAVEMVCDYLGAARAYLGKDFSYADEEIWWKDKRRSCKMHPAIKQFLSTVFYILAHEGQSLGEIDLKFIYEEVCRKNRPTKKNS